MSLLYSNNPKYKSQYGFTVPAVVLFVSAFLLIPVGFWLASAKSTLSAQVKGTETEGQKGVTLQIVSKAGSWDLYKFACETREECEKSLNAGKKLESTHGGATDGSIVPLSYSNSLKDYTYLKVFVKQSKSPIDAGYFNVVRGSESDFGRILSLDSATVIIIDLQNLQDSGQTSFVFYNE